MKDIHSFGTKEEIGLIHEKTVDILKNVGVRFHSDEAIEIFKNHGFKVDDDVVFFEEKQLWEAFKTIPQSFDWYGRNGDFITIGDGLRTKRASFYGSVFVHVDDETRAPVLSDYVNFQKLTHTSRVIDAAHPLMVDTPFLEGEAKSRFQMAATLLHNTKPILGLNEGKKQSIESIKMVKEFYDIHDKVLLLASATATAPLSYADHMAEAIIEYARAGQVSVVTSNTMSGLNAPITVASAILVANASILPGIVLSQLVNPGVPVVYSLMGHGVDLRYASCACGTPEDCLMYKTSKEMAKFYGIPCRSGGAATDGKDIDYQSGMESINSIHASLTSGTDLIHHACGALDTGMIMNAEKFVLDEIMIEYTTNYMKGYEVSEETLMYDKIAAAGPGGNFMEMICGDYKDHYYLPEILNRKPHGSWVGSGKPSLKENARKEVAKRIESYELPELSKAQSDMIRKHVPKELMES